MKESGRVQLRAAGVLLATSEEVQAAVADLAAAPLDEACAERMSQALETLKTARVRNASRIVTANKTKTAARAVKETQA